MERQAEGPLSFYQRFLRITFRTFRCSCARAPAHTDTRPRPYALGQIHTYIYIHTYPRSLSFLSSPPGPPPRQPLVLSSFTLLHAVLLLPLSSSFRAAFRPLRRRYCTYVCTRVYVCTCASSQSSYREVSCRTDSALPRREGGFVRG